MTDARLRIYIGAAPGVGKTYRMLRDAHQLRADGVDVVMAFVETYGRPETEAQLTGLELVPAKRIEYRGVTLAEMDLDAVLARKPKVALVDELAHTNVPGSRHEKRYQDVLDLLGHGIDVMTARSTAPRRSNRRSGISFGRAIYPRCGSSRSVRSPTRSARRPRQIARGTVSMRPSFPSGSWSR